MINRQESIERVSKVSYKIAFKLEWIISVPYYKSQNESDVSHLYTSHIRGSKSYTIENAKIGSHQNRVVLLKVDDKLNRRGCRELSQNKEHFSLSSHGSVNNDDLSSFSMGKQHPSGTLPST